MRLGITYTGVVHLVGGRKVVDLLRGTNSSEGGIPHPCSQTPFGQNLDFLRGLEKRNRLGLNQCETHSYGWESTPWGGDPPPTDTLWVRVKTLTPCGVCKKKPFIQLEPHRRG